MEEEFPRAEIMNKINDALEGTGFVAAGYSEEEGIMTVMIIREPWQ